MNRLIPNNVITCHMTFENIKIQKGKNGRRAPNHTDSVQKAQPLKGQTSRSGKSSSSMLLFYVHRNRTGLSGTGSPGRPPRLSHSSRALTQVRSFSVALRPQRPYRTIRDGEPRTATSTSDTAPELLSGTETMSV